MGETDGERAKEEREPGQESGQEPRQEPAQESGREPEKEKRSWGDGSPPAAKREPDVDFIADSPNDDTVWTRGPAKPLGDPAMIVDHVHVTYRVFGGRRLGASTGQKQSLYQRIFDRTTRQVGRVSEVHAVRGVSFVARQGESIGIIGRNGAGKSTLLRAIAGLMPYSEGAVYANGQSSLLGVNAALLPKLTGQRNIMLGGLALGLSKAQIEARFEEIVKFAGIGEFVYLPMNAYSSGMASRLRFAISTAKVPDILMIDEALSTGDSEFQKRSKDKILEVKDQAGTVFLVSHSANTVLALCERAIWLEKGKLVMDGPSEEVVEAYREAGPRRPGGQGRGAGPRPPA